ncbi:UDP-glucose 4-epimerase GalE, partial [Candidatus Dojkabacteria bacterium]|nr:UDP-glucose 4-epimerase GalE [Candidatus Dojkabacteria bacterium]
MQILVTGGNGFIGSHTTVELIKAGYEVVIIDNLSNSKISVQDRIKELTGKAPKFYQEDIRDKKALQRIFQENEIKAVIHFAAFKAVGESVANPLMYYSNNTSGMINLIECMGEAGVKDIVFSSSSTVYGQAEKTPIKENAPIHALNPYGRTKVIGEDILRDLEISDSAWNIAILRYFNPVGAHESGRIGEDPAGIPQGLLPFKTQVAVGKLEKLKIFGNDYPTPDGTGVRDYIHVVDLAVAHLRALEKLQQRPGLVTYNLGTGKGNSVLEMVAAFEKASGKKIPYEIADRRPGDAAESYCDTSLAEKELGWKAIRDLNKICEDAWRWQSNN